MTTLPHRAVSAATPGSESTEAPRRKARAIALMSGGLDSTLAAKLVKDQGVDVIGLHLVSPFGCREDVAKSAALIGVPLRFRDKGEAYLDLLENPRYGYGRNMNPCIDCRIFMFQLADVVRQDEGADFIVTGEVLGQRPMSQQRHALELIDKRSPLDGLIVRPLSAHCFAPSVPEERGWVDREKLLGISGRSRKEQFALAEKLGIQDYSTPSGGCLLTEAGFSARLQDFFKNPTYRNSDERMAQSELLRFGRHFRLSPTVKVQLGRDERENLEMAKLFKRANAVHFRPENFDGPSAVVFGAFGEDERQIVGAMIARYSRYKDLPEKRIAVEPPEGSPGSFVVARTIDDEALGQYRI